MMTRSQYKTLRERMIGHFQRARLRTQLLIVINGSLVILLIGFVVLDYRSNLQSRLHDKQVALSEEARTVASALDALRPQGRVSIQKYIDATCASMNEHDSPGHTIEVRFDDDSFEADASLHTHDPVLPGAVLVSGIYEWGGHHVRISERRAPVVMAALRAAVGRVFAIVLVGLIGAAMLNLLLLHLVTSPLERLVKEVRAIGRGTFGKPVSVSANAEIEGLASEITAMSSELARREKERKDQLERARRLQTHLAATPPVVGALEFAIEYHPADEVAGDFVDVITCPNGDTLVCIADVVGHGIHAAMGASVLKALLLAGASDEESPAAILESINHRFCQASLPEDFASMVLLRINQDATRVVYANAGHEPGYLRTAGGRCQRLVSTGMLLGLLEDNTYETEGFALEAGDTVILTSDGITEAQNLDRQLVGHQAIATAIRSAPLGGARSIALAVLDVARQHRGTEPMRDDETVLVFSRVHALNDSHTRSASPSPDLCITEPMKDGST